MFLRQQGMVLRYAMAVLLVVAAFLLRLSLDRFLGEDAHPYAAFYVAVTIAQFLLGLGPALTVLGLGFAASLWFIVPPRNALTVRGPSDFVEILLYFSVTGTIVVLMEWLQKARRQAAENALLAEARQLEIEASRDHLEELVDERTARLQKTVQELEHFSYALTHDMRAPLRAMGSYAELLREECSGMTPQGEEFCQRIRAAAGRLDSLICDSLNYTKVLQEDPALGTIDVGELLGELIDTYPDLQPHRERIQISPDLPRVLANQASLTQCFAHLLENGVKFAVPDRPLRIHIWSETHNDRVRIHVQDNGIGIPKHAQHRLFGMFQRLTSEHEGTGIGLAIVRKLAERMGGAVGVTSEFGQGSCFWVELLSAPDQPETPPAPTSGSAARPATAARAPRTLSPAQALD